MLVAFYLNMELLLCQKTLGWAILWFCFYRTCSKIISFGHSEYNCRIITLCHAVTVTAWACFLTFFNGTNPYHVLGLPNTSAQVAILTMSLGYFIYDFIWCLYYQTEGMLMLVHHVVSIILMTVCLHLKVSGTEIVATIFGTEITSIFLNMRWFLKEHDCYKDSVVGIFVDFLFVFLFLVVRIGVGGTLVYSVWMGDTSPMLVKIGGFIFYLINLIFLVQIMSFARYRVKSLSKSKDSVSNGKGSTQSAPKICDETENSKKSAVSNGVSCRKRNTKTTPQSSNDIELLNTHL